MMESSSRSIISTSWMGRWSRMPMPLPGLGMKETIDWTSDVGGMHCSKQRSRSTRRSFWWASGSSRMTLVWNPEGPAARVGWAILGLAVPSVLRWTRHSLSHSLSVSTPMHHRCTPTSPGATGGSQSVERCPMSQVKMSYTSWSLALLSGLSNMRLTVHLGRPRSSSSLSTQWSFVPTQHVLPGLSVQLRACV